MLTLGLAYAILRLAPWSPDPAGLGLDASWRWIVHDAWQRGLEFGTEIIFTAGPYGFLLTESFHPATYGLMLAVQVALIALLVLSLWVVLGRRVSTAWAVLLWIVVIVEPTGWWHLSQSLYFDLCLAFAAVYWSVDDAGQLRPAVRPERALTHVLAVALALVSLIKLPYLVLSSLILATVVVNEALRHRRVAWPAVTFVGAWFVLRAAAGQSVSGLGSYLRNSVEIASGFNAAMAVSGPLLELLVFLAAAVSLVLLWTAVYRPGRRGGSLVPVGIWVAFLCILFKICFVRHDGHALTAVPLLVPWSLVGLATVWPGASRRPKLAAAIALAASLLYAGIVVPRYLRIPLPSLVARELGNWPERCADAGRSLAGARRLRDRHEELSERIRRKYPLPPLAGEVDLYPYNQGLLLAHGLNYRTRPVIQSYSAYTPRLSEINSRRLRGPDAPDHVLFMVQPIDGRFPALDDSLSWPELLTRYQVREDLGGLLVLDRSRTPRSYSLRPLDRRTVRIGERFQLPAATSGKLIWVTLELHPTLRHRLAALAFRPPVVHVAVGLQDGRNPVYRLVPELARAGFVLSPLITDSREFADLFSAGRRAELRGNEGRRIHVAGTGGADLAWAYRPEFQLELWELELAR